MSKDARRSKHAPPADPAHVGHRRPPPIHELITALSQVLIRAGRLGEAIKALDRLRERPTPEGFHEEYYHEPPPDADEKSYMLGLDERWSDSHLAGMKPLAKAWDIYVFALRAFRTAIGDAKPCVTPMAPYMDALDQPVRTNWTGLLSAELQSLLRLVPSGIWGDLETSPPGIVELEAKSRPVGARMDELKDIPPAASPVSPSIGRRVAAATAHNESTLPGTVTMDATEVAALRTLAERPYWGVDELPESIHAGLLRSLDDQGWVEARYVVMQNQQKYPGDPTPASPTRHGWISPIRTRGDMGEWDAVLKKRERDAWHHPNEVRVSERGRAMLFRATTAEQSVRAASQASNQDRLWAVRERCAVLLRTDPGFRAAIIKGAERCTQMCREMAAAERLNRARRTKHIQSLLEKGKLADPDRSSDANWDADTIEAAVPAALAAEIRAADNARRLRDEEMARAVSKEKRDFTDAERLIRDQARHEAWSVDLQLDVAARLLEALNSCGEAPGANNGFHRQSGGDALVASGTHEWVRFEFLYRVPDEITYVDPTTNSLVEIRGLSKEDRRSIAYGRLGFLLDCTLAEPIIEQTSSTRATLDDMAESYLIDQLNPLDRRVTGESRVSFDERKLPPRLAEALIEMIEPAHSPKGPGDAQGGTGPLSAGAPDATNTGVLSADLINAAKFSSDTFLQILKNAGLYNGSRGWQSRRRRFTPHEVSLLRKEVLEGTYVNREKIAEAWLPCSSEKSQPKVGRSADSQPIGRGSE